MFLLVILSPWEYLIIIFRSINSQLNTIETKLKGFQRGESTDCGRDHSCDILAKNMAAFCYCPKAKTNKQNKQTNKKKNNFA